MLGHISLMDDLHSALFDFIIPIVNNLKEKAAGRTVRRSSAMMAGSPKRNDQTARRSAGCSNDEAAGATRRLFLRARSQRLWHSGNGINVPSTGTQVPTPQIRHFC
jgi:hypothetical protein